MRSSPASMGRSITRAWQRLSEHEAARIRDAFLRSPTPPAAPRGVLALGLAVLVLAGYAALLGLGLWALWLTVAPGTPVIMRLCLGFLTVPLLLSAVANRPRFGGPPGLSITPEQTPELHRLIAEVATELRTPLPTHVTLLGTVNAFMGRSGFPPRPTLGLGLPLLYALPPQERVALIAHELAHERSGDPTRGGVVGLALQVLDHVRVPLALVAFIPAGLYHLLLSLTGAAQQQAEFRADLLAAHVAGSQATASLLDHIHLADALESALQKQRHQPEHAHAFLELRHLWATMPEARRQQRRDEVAAQRVRLDDSHPPTADRRAVVQAYPQPPQVVLDEAWAARIDAELTPFAGPIERWAYEAYQEQYAAW